MRIPLVKQTARQEIALMREYMGVWQERTFDNWARGRPEAEVRARHSRFRDNPFTAFDADEMLKYQPSIAAIVATTGYFDRNQASLNVRTKIQ